MSNNRQQLRTQSDVAKFASVSTKTVAQWRDNFADFPQRNSAGNYSRREITAFCRRHQLGMHNPIRTTLGQKQRADLYEARRRRTIEQSENMRITNERLKIEQQRELEGIVFAADVEQFRTAARAMVEKVHRDYFDDIARVLSDSPNEDTWPATRAKVLEITRALPGRMAAAMKGLA